MLTIKISTEVLDKNSWIIIPTVFITWTKGSFALALGWLRGELDFEFQIKKKLTEN